MRVRIGRVGRPHGLDGAFFVEQPSDDRRWWKTGARFLAGGARSRSSAHRTASGRPVIKLDRTSSAARCSRSSATRCRRPAEDEYYAFELVGLEVVEETGRALGTVEVVTPGVANDVLELDTGVLLPMVEDCIRDVDLDAGSHQRRRGIRRTDAARRLHARPARVRLAHRAAPGRDGARRRARPAPLLVPRHDAAA